MEGEIRSALNSVHTYTFIAMNTLYWHILAKPMVDKVVLPQGLCKKKEVKQKVMCDLKGSVIHMPKTNCHASIW